MTSVAYGCCVGSDEKFYHYVNRGDSAARCIYTRRDQTSIADAYNGMLDAARDDGFNVLILQHDDLEITDPAGEEKLVEALESGATLAGVAGGSTRSGLAWWNADPVGRVRWDGGVLDFGARSGDVEMLDGCLLAFGRWAIKNLRFAPRPGFHGYDGDICMRATAAGRRVVVADLDVFHHTALGFDDEASHLDWLDADREFRQRWEI